MRHRRSFIVLLLFLALFGSSRGEDDSPIGLWENEDAYFRIFETDGKIGAKIVSLKVPKTPEGKEKTDINNPDPAKRNIPIAGLVFMRGFQRKSDRRWENGTIYDPKTGNTYSCFMELQSADRIMVRGFIGISLIGRTAYWSRVR
jgi:uncharacterized protein (DUF2147 family)